MFDLNDGYQREQAERVFPWLIESRRDVIGGQIEQFAFLTKLQLKAKLDSTAEVVRLFMILGGREKLVFMNNVALAAAGKGGNDGRSMFDGIAGWFKTDRGGRFLLGYNDDEWFQAAAPGGDVRPVLESLAVVFIHLFPALTVGKLDVFADPINQRTGKNAKKLVEIAHEFCQSSAPDAWLENVLRGGSLGKHSPETVPSVLGGPKNTSFSFR